MTTRADIANWAASQIGTVKATGYNGPNPYSADLGRPPEAWCADFATDAYKRNGIPLPSMQPGCPQGFAYVPDGLGHARTVGAVIPSWQAKPGDLVCFDWSGDGVADHVELCTALSGTNLVTIGGNSGGTITGGVNAHNWRTEPPAGNTLILGVIDAGQLVTFGADPVPPKPAPAPAPGTPRLLMLKSPYMTGLDVRNVQMALDRHSLRLVVDGVYGPATRWAVMTFQGDKYLAVDGVVGPLTRKALGL